MHEKRTRSPRETTDMYYGYANEGDWEAWCDLFTEDMVMDEQLAGRIEGLDALRPMMVVGMPQTYSRFQNTPRHVIIDGDQAGVVSHVSAASMVGAPIEADVMIYFRFRHGEISYMANFHDSRPFAPVLRQQVG